MKKFLGCFIVLFLLTGCGVNVANSKSVNGQQSPSVTQNKNAKGTSAMITFNLKHVTNKRVGTAKDMPKGKVVVKLPLYPQASTTNRTTKNLYDSYPATPYLKEAKQKYTLPVSEQTAEQWYNDTLKQKGYKISGSGSSGNIKTGVSSKGITFVSKKNKNLTVLMSFQSLGTNQTLVQYDVQYIATPAREPGSILPKNLTRVVMTYKPRGYLDSHKKEIKTITDPKTLSELRSMINQLKPDTAGVKHCALDTGQGADLKFTTSDHKIFDVTIKPACMDVKINQGQTLNDNGLWKYVSNLFNK